MLIYIVATAVVNLTQFCAGEYMGRYSKIIGVAMAFVYGLILMISLKKALCIPAFEVHLSGMVSKINLAYLIIPIIQIIGIILTVLLSHYGLEQEKWNNGFTVSMKFLSKDNGNKFTLLYRGGLATLLALFMCYLCAKDIVSGLGVIIIAVLWWASNTVLKPRGSYLYTFWGRGRAIANEFVMAAMLITTIICSRGTIKKTELIALALSFIVSFVVAFVARMVNNVI